MTLSALASAMLTLTTFGYIALCAASPFGTCRKCDGLGFQLRRTRNGKPKRGKHCRRCKATGLRLRTGRRLFNLTARTYRDGTR